MGAAEAPISASDITSASKPQAKQPQTPHGTTSTYLERKRAKNELLLGLGIQEQSLDPAQADSDTFVTIMRSLQTKHQGKVAEFTRQHGNLVKTIETIKLLFGPEGTIPPTATAISDLQKGINSHQKRGKNYYNALDGNAGKDIRNTLVEKHIRSTKLDGTQQYDYKFIPGSPEAQKALIEKMTGKLDTLKKENKDLDYSFDKSTSTFKVTTLPTGMTLEQVAKAIMTEAGIDTPEVKEINKSQFAEKRPTSPGAAKRPPVPVVSPTAASLASRPKNAAEAAASAATSMTDMAAAAPHATTTEYGSLLRRGPDISVRVWQEGMQCVNGKIYYNMSRNVFSKYENGEWLDIKPLNGSESPGLYIYQNEQFAEISQNGKHMIRPMLWHAYESMPANDIQSEYGLCDDVLAERAADAAVEAASQLSPTSQEHYSDLSADNAAAAKAPQSTPKP